jgi:hypothetical protein
MAETMHFLAEEAAFAPGMVLQPGHLSPPLAAPAPVETSEMHVSGLMHAAAAKATAWGMVPLLSFIDFTAGCLHLMAFWNYHSRVTQKPLQAPHFSSQPPSGAWLKSSQ